VLEEQWRKEGRDLSLPAELRPEAAERQRQRMVRSEIFERIEEALDEHKDVLSQHHAFISTEALFEVIGLEPDDKSQLDRRLTEEVKQAMTRLGWMRDRMQREHRKMRGYSKRGSNGPVGISAELHPSFKRLAVAIIGAASNVVAFKR